MAQFVIQLSSGERLTYCNDPASLTREDGTPIDLSKFAFSYIDEPHKDNDQIDFCPTKPVVGKLQPRILKIQLGLGCNYSCSYCSQGGQQEDATSSKDAEDFSLEWAIGTPKKVELWGGEPLLYWKKIEALVPKIRARFGQVRISMVTNGTLLTKEKIDWLYDNGFSIAISHDGPGQALRGADPLDDPETLALWKYAVEKFGERLCINSVITAKNYDLFAMWMWFEQRLGTVKLNVEDVVTDYGGAKMTEEDMQAMYESVKKYASSGLALVFPRIRWSMLQFMGTIAAGKPLTGSHQVCGMDRKDQLAVDLKGHVLTCQNAGADSGHIIGTTDKLKDVVLDTSVSFMQREHCHECPVVHMCYGSCMFLGGKEFDSSCRASYWYNRALLEGVIKLLTGKEVDTISGWKPTTDRRVIPIKVATC